MDVPSETVIAILTYLLPGFITAALVYVLTPEPRPIPFERVVQALIFTMLVQVGVTAVGAGFRWVGLHWFPIGLWTEQVRLGWSVLLAGILGLFIAWAANTDRIHEFLRTVGLTCQTSFSSEWYGVFSRNKGYIVLHLTGQRRLYGWPEEWPSTPGRGHFVMAQAEWLDEEKRTELTGVDRILIRAEDVEMVELMKIVDTVQEQANGRSKATDTATTTAESGLPTHGRGQTAVRAAAVQATATTTAAGQEVAEPRR
jgi:hypothetical protein